MATSIPRLGNRGTLNTNVTGTIKSGIYTSQTITTNSFAGSPRQDLVFYTLNPGSKIGSLGQLEQLRVDNSGNIVYNGTMCPSTQTIIRQEDVSFNLRCHGCNVLFYGSTVGNATQAGLQVAFRFPVWDIPTPYDPVACLDIMCVMSDTSSNPTYSCFGKIGKITTGTPFFDTSTNGLTVQNGTVTVSSKPGVKPAQPYYLFIEFIPTTIKTKIKTVYICITQSTKAMQIEDIFFGPT